MAAPKMVVKPAGKKAPAGRRGIGRPASEKQSVGKEALIEAACELLKTTPPGAITRALIARETGVDPSLIRYYFSNHSALLVAAAKRLTDAFAVTVQTALGETDDSPESRLAARVGALVDLIAEHPYFHRLIVEEIMPSAHPVAREMFTQLTHRATGGYDELIKLGVAAGKFRAVDSGLLFSCVIGMCEFYLQGRQLRGIANDALPEQQADRTQYKAFIVDLVLNGIRVR